MNLKYGKAQSSMLILVIMVSVFVILWFFLSFKQVGGGKRLIKETELRKLSSYLDSAKGFSRQSLILGVHAAVDEIARNGGDINPSGFARTWICNNIDTSPSVEEVRFFLSNKTLELLNNYVNNFDIEDLPDIKVTSFKCVDYNVNEESVFSGKNDEMFNVGAYGSNVSIEYKEDRITSKNEVYETISQNRFWYLYRGFKEWTNKNAQALVECLCDCMSLICRCGLVSGKCVEECKPFYECTISCIKSTAEKLNGTFDEYVSCDGQLTCCIVNSGDFCKDLPRGCVPWENPPDCYGCFKGNAGELCSSEYIPKFAAGNDEEECKGTCSYWWYGKAAVRANFFCEDRKYTLSTKGERTLKFNVGFTYHRMLRCEVIEKCGCYDGECRCPPLESPFTWCLEDCVGRCQ